VVIDYFNVERVALLEAEADSPLIVDPDAPLTFSVMLQSFQPVRGREAQIIQRCRRIELRQPHRRSLSDLRRQSPGLSRREESLRLGGSERTDHGLQCKLFVYNRQLATNLATCSRQELRGVI
jgi:hypothetical protein